MAYQESLIALADPTRRSVFETLAAAPRPVGEIAKTLPVSRPAVSQHLKVLSEAGLVVVRAEGTKRIYAVRPEALVELRAWLDGFWGQVLDSFANEISNRNEDDHD